MIFPTDSCTQVTNQVPEAGAKRKWRNLSGVTWSQCGTMAWFSATDVKPVVLGHSEQCFCDADLTYELHCPSIQDSHMTQTFF